MNLTAAKEKRAAILARVERDDSAVASMLPTRPATCECGKAWRHKGRCARTGFPVKALIAKEAKAKPTNPTEPQPAPAPPVVAPTESEATAALVTQPACHWAIKFEEGDDKIDLAGSGRERFEKVINALHALIA